MSLPYSVVPRGKVEFSSGEVVEIRGLSRAEALLARERYREGGVTAMEVYTISRALDVEDSDDVESWYNSAANGDVDKLSAAVARLSGLDVDEGKGDAGTSLSATPTSSTTS